MSATGELHDWAAVDLAELGRSWAGADVAAMDGDR
jgi:hypothetical protein